MKVLQQLTKATVIFGSLLLPDAAAASQCPQSDYYDVNTTPNPRFVSHDYRPGEVIVKFRESARTSIRVNAQKKFLSSGLSEVDKVMAALGAQETERLMPLTGKNVSTRQLRALNGKPMTDTNLSTLYRVKMDLTKVKSVEEAVEQLSALPEVEYAEPNYIVRTCDYEKEPMYAQQWGIPAIGLDKLWKIPVTGNSNPVIAILDTGVDTEHPDLKDNIYVNYAEMYGADGSDDDGNGFTDDVNGWDFVNQSPRMRDNNGHGTHCAGIAAASGNNGIGITGANPEARILPVTVMQSDGVGDVATIIKGIDYAVAQGADVISMSFGGYAYSMAEEQALAKAYQKAVLVAAAGNDDICIYPHRCEMNNKNGNTMFPAGFTFVLGVQATDRDGSKASFSNFDEDGPLTSTFGEEKLYNYELSAPGTNILSTYPGGRYKTLNGTSMACPLAAGAISRLMSAKEYASKELLFGDLIASANGNMDVWSAYNIKDSDRKPSLSLITYTLNDKSEGDGDGRADAGELIELYPVLKNAWGNAENIVLELSLDEMEDPTVVEFIDNKVSFGSALSSYGKATSENPLRFRINKDCVDGRHIRLQLSATCDNMAEPLQKEIVLSVENGVELGGVLREDMTLVPDVHYIVTSTLGVPDGVTLTILPGTVVKFKDGTGIQIAETGHLVANGAPKNLITFTKTDMGTGTINDFSRAIYIDNSQYVCDTVSYCSFEDLAAELHMFNYIKMENCVLNNIRTPNICISDATCTNIFNCLIKYNLHPGSLYYKCNFINNNFVEISNTFNIKACNSFSNMREYKPYSIGSSMYLSPSIIHMEEPSYLGSSRIDIVQPTVWDIKYPGYNTFAEIDLSNMLTRPVAEAHGIVWKVVVNGYDAQDEYEMLPPLGVGRHKFEVYFNRPMNKKVAPTIAMGVRPPYTQTAINAYGSWNEEGTVYTAYLNIMGKDDIDGVNRIYVSGAEDDEFFEIPVENMRFNVNVQAAGAMSTGFEATPGLGKVELQWESPEENFEDMLGYNLYRYTVNADETTSDTLRINETLLDDETFTDYDVTPGTTYCYYYKVQNTGLTENSPSKTVAATPLTSIKGDANGSMGVDVADVVTELAYMTNEDPKPFIFEAADVNSDTDINILDVVGTINIILHPNQTATAGLAATATYTVENGVLYVESPVALGGIQLSIQAASDSEFRPTAALDGFERVIRRMEDGSYLFLAYSMSGRSIEPGRTALLELGNGSIASIILSDTKGANILPINGTVTGIGSIEAMQMRSVYPNPFDTEVTVAYAIGTEGRHRVEFIISDLSGRRIDTGRTEAEFGEHTWTWRPAGIPNGIYLLGMYVDGKLMQTEKLIKQ
ncbi:MAG: S8 family serine peptidase [Clostridium sp.]|nr:S8 family serine peptidase [Clostridium sp.]